ERKIYRFAKQGDIGGLVEMGFSLEVAQQAVDKVMRGSG
ncbi:hypothetical protein LCGC14_2238490, partial [marine sediment metagenome]